MLGLNLGTLAITPVLPDPLEEARTHRTSWDIRATQTQRRRRGWWIRAAEVRAQREVLRPAESVERHCAGSHGVQALRLVLQAWCLRHRESRHSRLTRLIVLVCLEFGPPLRLDSLLFSVFLTLSLRGEAADRREAEVYHEDAQDGARAREAGFRLLAVLDV